MPRASQDNDQAAAPVLLPGFEYRRINVEGVTIRCAISEAGPPLLRRHALGAGH